MRCDNCGWMNPDGVELCQKCNQKLMKVTDEHSKVADKVVEETKVSLITCDKCGREYDAQSSSCPNCGFANTHNRNALSNDATQSSLNKTVVFTTDAAGQPDAESVTPAVQKINIKDNSDLKRTIVCENSHVEVSVDSSVADSEIVNPKKTVVFRNEEPVIDKPAQNVQNNVKRRGNLKVTVADVNCSDLQKLISEAEAESRLQDTVFDSFCFKLESMDHKGETPVILTITSTAEIALKSGDIILVAGERYRVV